LKDELLAASRLLIKWWVGDSTTRGFSLSPVPEGWEATWELKGEDVEEISFAVAKHVRGATSESIKKATGEWH